MHVYDQARALAKAIQDTEEYRVLKQLKAKVDSDPALTKIFREYRTKQYEIQKLQFMKQQVPAEMTGNYGQLLKNVLANPVLKAFLEAEQKFGVIMADIQKVLFNGLEIQ